MRLTVHHNLADAMLLDRSRIPGSAGSSDRAIYIVTGDDLGLDSSATSQRTSAQVGIYIPIFHVRPKKQPPPQAETPDVNTLFAIIAHRMHRIIPATS